MPFRAFIAVDLPPDARLTRIVQDLHEASRDLKVVSADHLHVTLKFLGDTEEGLVPEIVSAMREASAGLSPLTIQVRGTGAFPNVQRPRVFWVGLVGADSLARVAKSLNENLVALGFEKETRAWSPHVTLARVRDPRGPRGLDRVQSVLRAHEDDTFAEALVGDLRLKKSVLTPQGPEYTTVESVRLVG